METINNSIKTNLALKPIPLRAIFILNGLKMFLPFVFYYVITTQNISIGGLDPILMLYTGIGYILSFATLVYFIINRNFTGVRIVAIIDIIISIPAKAIIGVVIAIISLLLTLNSKVKAYFAD